MTFQQIISEFLSLKMNTASESFGENLLLLFQIVSTVALIPHNNITKVEWEQSLEELHMTSLSFLTE